MHVRTTTDVVVICFKIVYPLGGNDTILPTDPSRA
jgi:hypothetical protein